MASRAASSSARTALFGTGSRPPASASSRRTSCEQSTAGRARRTTVQGTRTATYSATPYCRVLPGSGLRWLATGMA